MDFRVCVCVCFVETNKNNKNKQSVTLVISCRGKLHLAEKELVDDSFIYSQIPSKVCDFVLFIPYSIYSLTTPQEFPVETRVDFSAVVNFISSISSTVGTAPASTFFVLGRHRLKDLVPFPHKLDHGPIPIPSPQEGFLLGSVVGDVGLHDVHSWKEKELKASLGVVIVGLLLLALVGSGSCGGGAGTLLILLLFGSKEGCKRGLLFFLWWRQ